MEELEQMITTVDIAKMMGMSHKNILRKIEGRENEGRHIKGIIDVLNEHHLEPVKYFTKSSYVDSKGESRPCYKVTRKGCEFLANKFQGEKGIIFTARYIERFHQMEDALKHTSELQNQNKSVRVLPDFSGHHADDKRFAAAFIQDYIVDHNDDAGLYRAYRMRCLHNGQAFLPAGMFAAVKKSVIQLKLRTGYWILYTNEQRMISG